MASTYEYPLYKQYLFTVSNLTHQLIAPQQYRDIISESSQYHVIPGYMSDKIDDPWDIILILLPQSSTTIIDVTLFIKDINPITNQPNKILARYLLYKQQIIGIKTSSTHINNKSSQSPTKYNIKTSQIPTKYNTKARQQCYQTKYQSKKQNIKYIQIPQKIINYYEQNKITNYQKKVRVGQFYLITNKFKIALFFQSQIRDQCHLLPYIKMGCQIISIVNDQQFNYSYFANNYADPVIKKTIEEGISSKIIRVREVCAKYLLFFMYSGCRACPRLSQLYYTKSLLGNCYQQDNNILQTEDIQFIPVITPEQIQPHVLQLNYNPNLTNTSNILQLDTNNFLRLSIISNDSIFKNQLPTLQKDIQSLQSIQLNPNTMQISPMTLSTRIKIQQYMELYQSKLSNNQRQAQSLLKTNNNNDRQPLFRQINISGKSMIRCLYVFNIINLFILSKPINQRQSFIIGVPFTNKTKNLFDTIVYIYDRLRCCFQTKFVGLKRSYEFSDFVLLYRYTDQLAQYQHDYSIQQSLLAKITNNNTTKIPTLINLLKQLQSKKQQDTKRVLYLCSDDQEQKHKLNKICIYKNIQLRNIDILLVDQFNLPLDIRTQHKAYQNMLQLQQHQNVLQQFHVQLRHKRQSILGDNYYSKLSIRNKYQIKNNANDYNRMVEQQYDDVEFIKLKRQLLRKRFNTIDEALYYIIVKKKFLYNNQQSKYRLNQLLNKLKQKYTSNIKTLTPINTFFITNTKQSIDKKVSQISRQLMIKYPNVEIIQISSQQQQQELLEQQSDDQYQYQNNSTNQSFKFINYNLKSNVNNNINLNNTQKCNTNQQKTPLPIKKPTLTQQQLYRQISQRCKQRKIRRQRKQIIQCHRCSTQCNRKQLVKCRSCYQFICIGCVQQLTGACNIKVLRQLQRYCPVCNKTCMCQKCTKKNTNTNNNNSKSSPYNKQQLQLSEQLRLQLFDTNNKQNEYLQISFDKNCTDLFKSFSSQQQENKQQIKYCNRCQFINYQTKRAIWLECKLCGVHQCYQCVKQKYVQENYKFITINKLYINWKCFLCDDKWKQFMKNKYNLNNQLLNNKQLNLSSPKQTKNITYENNMDIEYTSFNSLPNLPINNNNAINCSNTSNVINDNKYELSKYTLNDGKATVYLPPIDPLSNTPKFPLPSSKTIQQPKVNAQNKTNLLPITENQQNRIPIQPIPPKPLFSITIRQSNLINNQQKSNQQENINKKIEQNIKKKQNQRSNRNSSQSNNDSKKINKEDNNKKRNKYQVGEGGPIWKMAKRAKQSSSSSSSSSNSSSSSSRSSSQSSSGISESSNDKKIIKSRRQHTKKRRNRRSSSSSSSSKSSSSSSSQNNKRQDKQRKPLDLKISIMPRVDNNKDRERSRQKQNDDDTNTRRYYPARRSNSKDNNNKAGKIINNQEQTKSKRTINNNNDQKRRSQSSSKKQTISPIRQQEKVKKQKNNALFNIAEDLIKQQINQFKEKQIELTKTKLLFEVSKKIVDRKDQSQFVKSRLLAEASKKIVEMKDPRLKVIEKNKEEKMQVERSETVISPKLNPIATSPIPINSNQSIYKTNPTNTIPSQKPNTPTNSLPSNNNKQSQSRQYIRTPQSRQYIRTQQSRQFARQSTYNPQYLPSIRTLATEYNTNNSFYANYHNQQSKNKSSSSSQQQNNNDNKNLLFVKNKKKKHSDQDDVDY